MGEAVAYHKERSLKGSMRENGFRAVGGLAQRLASGIAAERSRGASIARLRAEWSAIVGPDLARITRPEALTASRGGVRAGPANFYACACRVPPRSKSSTWPARSSSA